MGTVDRKLGRVTRAVLERVRKAKAEDVPKPEFELYRRESRLKVAESVLYNLFPEGMARLLGRIFPKNESVSRVVDVYDFRTTHGFPSGYIPAGYQLPLRD